MYCVIKATIDHSLGGVDCFPVGGGAGLAMGGCAFGPVLDCSFIVVVVNWVGLLGGANKIDS